MKKFPEYSRDPQQAQALADRINTYWAERGGRANASVHRDAVHGRAESFVYVIRSDMVNGMPEAA